MRSIIRIGTVIILTARNTICNVAASIPSKIQTITVPPTISIAGLDAIGIAAPGDADGSDIRCADPDLRPPMVPTRTNPTTMLPPDLFHRHFDCEARPPCRAAKRQRCFNMEHDVSQSDLLLVVSVVVASAASAKPVRSSISR